jgi:hypothetical protein
MVVRLSLPLLAAIVWAALQSYGPYARAADWQFLVADSTADTAPQVVFINELCELCEPPGTLLHWSYGDEEGGPPGRDEPLSSDRPDFTETSTTVGRGVVQLEMGYTYFRDREAGTTNQSHSYPELLARIGVLAEWLEFRVAYNHVIGSVETTPLPLENFSGGEDLYLGFKIGLTGQAGILPEMALTPQWTVPTGSEELSAGIVLPGVNWLYGWDITEWLSTAGSTQLNRAVDDNDDVYTEFAQSWTIGYTFTERWGGYTEWFVLAPCGSDVARTQHYFNGGFIFPLTNDLQLDIRAGVGLSRASDDFFAGSGLVIRL